MPFTITIPLPLPGDADADASLARADTLALELGARATALRDAPLALLLLTDDRPDDAALAALVATADDARLLDWGSAWQADARPFAVDPLWIVPAGTPVPAHLEDQLHLVIDAGPIFGSGLHPTTRLCLERVVALAPVESVLDVGTGTGILALAALRLGAERATATDIDPAARALARQNARENKLDLEVVDDAEVTRDRRYALVLANVLGPELIALAPELAQRVDHEGTLILSGVRPDLREDVLATFTRHGLACVLTTARDGWLLLELVARW